MTGFGTAASLLGRPDVGLLGMSEMVDNARRIVQAVAARHTRSSRDHSRGWHARGGALRVAALRRIHRFHRPARNPGTGAAVQQPAGPNEELNGKHIYQAQRE